MKVLVICSRLCYGGAERVAVMWANGFADRGHDVLLASNYHDEVSYVIDDHVRRYDVFPESNNRIKKWLGALSSLRKIVREEKPDVVIGVMSTCSMMAKLASLGSHCYVIATEHNSFERPESAPMTRYGKFTKFIVNKAYSGVTVLTEADKRVIGNKLRLVYVLPNPLALMPLSHFPLKDRILLAAGRLDDWHYKGFDVLIRAWGQINRNKSINNGQLKIDNGQIDVQSLKLTGWRLQIAGTGSEESLQYLKQLCKESGVEDTVDFLGFRTDIKELYKQSEIFVLSSRYEGFGLVLIEAMSQGCACVACDYKGRQREIFEDLKIEKVEELKSGSYEVCKNGILCPPEDVNSLASALKKMMEDEDYRHQAQKNAIERSKYYSVENTMDRWEVLLKEVVKK